MTRREGPRSAWPRPLAFGRPGCAGYRRIYDSAAGRPRRHCVPSTAPRERACRYVCDEARQRPWAKVNAGLGAPGAVLGTARRCAGSHRSTLTSEKFRPPCSDRKRSAMTRVPAKAPTKEAPMFTLAIWRRPHRTASASAPSPTCRAISASYAFGIAAARARACGNASDGSSGAGKVFTTRTKPLRLDVSR